MSFLGGSGGVIVLRGASVCPVISPRPPPSDDGSTKVGLCFPNVTVLENGERVMIKVEWQRKWPRSPSQKHCQAQTISTSSEGLAALPPNSPAPPTPDKKNTRFCLENMKTQHNVVFKNNLLYLRLCKRRFVGSVPVEFSRFSSW